MSGEAIQMLKENEVIVAYTISALDAVAWKEADPKRRAIQLIEPLIKEVKWMINGKISLTNAEIAARLAVRKD